MAHSKKRTLRYSSLIMLCLTLLAFGLRVYRLGTHSLWYDELLELDIAQGPVGDILPQLVRHAAMPLDYFLLHGWIKLGRMEIWVRWPALIFGTLAIPLIYWVARHLFKRRVGIFAASLLAAASFSVEYSQEARPYALLLLLVLAGFGGLWQVYKTDRNRYWLLVLVGVAGAGLTHYFALFMLLPMGLFVAIQQLRGLKKFKYWQYTIYFAVCLFILVATLVSLDRMRFVYSVGLGFSRVLTQPETMNLPAPEKPNRGSGPATDPTFFVDQVFGPLASNEPLALIGYNLFLLIAVLSLLPRHRRDRAAILLLLGWLFLPIILIHIFLQHRGTFYATRYILYTLPAYLMLVAYGIDTLLTLVTKYLASTILDTPPARRLGTAIFVVSAFLLLMTAEFDDLQAYYAADSTEDWRAVGQLLHNQAGPNDAVIAVKAEPTINWYYPPATAPFGIYNRSQPIWQAINAHPRRWFVLSSYSQKRDQGLRAWLQNNQAVMIGIDRRVVIFLQQEGLTAAELLGQVKAFSLPHKAVTYASLARQFEDLGDRETGQMFYQKAIELAKPNYRKALETEREAKLASPLSGKLRFNTR